MKKLPPLLLLLLAASSLYAQDAEHRTGITFGVGQSGNDISVRRIFSNQWAALGSLGYTRATVYNLAGGTSQPVDADSWTLAAGARRYLAQQPLRPFAQADAGLRLTEVPGCGHARSPYANVGGGVEYSLAPRVSIEGTAGLSYSELRQRCSLNGVDYKLSNDSLSTFRTALSVTFYF